MFRFVKFLTAALALLLPWHGAITVFLPDEFRWWKEIALALLILTIIGLEILAKKRAPLSQTERWAIVFLLWCGFLVLINPDVKTAAVAARYLGLGFLVFLIFSRAKNFGETLFETFVKFFVPAAAASVIFGLWIKFGGGADIVQDFYSKTISSWVPGQTIPLWHKTDGIIRLQGASSGPIEFSHLLLAALACVLGKKCRHNYWLQILFSVILLAGVFQSFSRAAILGTFLLFTFFAIRNVKIPRKKLLSGIFSAFVIFAGVLFLNKNLVRNFIERDGTSAHFSRPIEAIKMGIESPLRGNLGKLGPAARAKNLEEKNDDRAPIAENVFADWFAQLGVIGITLGLGFVLNLIKKVDPRFWGFFVAAFVTMSLATIFDMTPLAIAFFALFAFSQKSEKIHKT